MSNHSRRRPSHYLVHIPCEAIVPRNEYENRSKSTFWQGGKENEGPTHQRATSLQPGIVDAVKRKFTSDKTLTRVGSRAQI